jgi:hypothetical protein
MSLERRVLCGFEALVSGGGAALNITAIVGTVAVLVPTLAGGEDDGHGKIDQSRDQGEPASPGSTGTRGKCTVTVTSVDILEFLFVSG